MTHICVSKLTIIGSDDVLSPGRRQAIIWTNAGILLIRTLGTNFSEILSEIHAFSFKKMHLKMSSAKWRPFCLGLNVLIYSWSLPGGIDLNWNSSLYPFTMQRYAICKRPCFNTLRPRRNGRHFAYDIFKRIFLNGNARISIKISLKFVPKSPINNIPALDQIMVWRRSGDKPLSEPMMVGLLTHICVTQPQWVKSVQTLVFNHTQETPQIQWALQCVCKILSSV